MDETRLEFTPIERRVIELFLTQVKIDSLDKKEDIQKHIRSISPNINDYYFVWVTNQKLDVVSSYITKHIYCKIDSYDADRIERLLVLMPNILDKIIYYKRVEDSLVTSIIEKCICRKHSKELTEQLDTMVSKIKEAYTYYKKYINSTSASDLRALADGVRIYTPHVWRIAAELYSFNN